jgi:hypothetical protein
VADISASSSHHFLVFCHIFANFWKKSKLIVFWKAENLVRRSSVVVKQHDRFTRFLPALGSDPKCDVFFASTLLVQKNPCIFCTNSYVDSGGK